MSTNKKYKLLKDLPGIKSPIELRFHDYHKEYFIFREDGRRIYFQPDVVEKDTDGWFELVNEEIKQPEERITAKVETMLEEVLNKTQSKVTMIFNHVLDRKEFDILPKIIEAALNDDAGEGFVWTDELVCEFTSWSRNAAPTFQGRYSDVEQFKKFKATGATWDGKFARLPKTTSTNEGKEWEIVAYRMKNKHDVITTKRENGLFKNILDAGDGHYDEPKDNDSWEIYSERRISTGAVFTKGDKLIHNDGSYQTEIFDFVPNHLGWFYFERHKDHVRDLNNFKKLPSPSIKPEPLFRTEDGKDIFENDTFWWVAVKEETNVVCGDEKWSYGSNIAHAENTLPTTKNYKYFGSKAEAENWLAWNKPLFSLAEIMSQSGLHKKEPGEEVWMFQRNKMTAIAQQKVNLPNEKYNYHQ